MEKTVRLCNCGWKVTQVAIDDESLEIELFDEETNKKHVIDIYGEHLRDCCEHVYCDFSTMIYYAKALQGKYLTKIEFKGLQDEGFLMRFYDNFNDCISKIFIGCYDEQNGYYSGNLTLMVEVDKKVKLNEDIGTLTETHYY